jgi:large subunit ribosomal protein L17
MRHGKTVNHLGRTKSHREALLANMANSLIKNKRISTTLAKAKELRKYVEPILTKAKNDTTHSRRVVFSYLQDKESIIELFGAIAEKIAERNGGYTRIIKLGNRQGDNADIALIELVDYNEALLITESEDTSKAKRSRRGKAKKADVVADGGSSVEVVEEAAPAVEATVEETPEVVAEVVEETPEVEEAPKADEATDEEKA